MKQGIIVLGMPRSGTSLVADLVYRWGAYAGPKQALLKADEWNPQGYWEYIPLKRLNDELLAAVRASERVPPATDEIVAEKASDSHLREKARRLLARMQAGTDVWFWKDPRLPILLPFWNTIWDEMIYVIPIRNPVDIAGSQKKLSGQQMPADEFPFSAAFLYWQCFMLAILRNTEGNRRKIFIEYEQLIADPVEGCERLCTFLDNQCGTQHDRAGKIHTMAAAVNPNLRRNRSPATFFEAPMAAAEQKALYSFLRRKVTDPAEPFKAADFPIFPGWREYLQIIDLLFQVLVLGDVSSSATNWHDLMIARGESG